MQLHICCSCPVPDSPFFCLSPPSAACSQGQFYAFDTAAKSRSLLGGGTSYMANLTFINDNPGVMQLANWTWGQQGVYVVSVCLVLGVHSHGKLPDVC